MSPQPGKNLVIGIDGEENNTVITGLRISEIAFNATLVDSTDMSSVDMWRVLLDGSGKLSARIVASGLFCDTAADTILRSAFFSQSLQKMALCISDFGNIFGRFKITDLGYSGTFDSEIKYSITLMSAGTLSFQNI